MKASKRPPLYTLFLRGGLSARAIIRGYSARKPR